MLNLFQHSLGYSFRHIVDKQERCRNKFGMTWQDNIAKHFQNL
jgi:hypothetical protein